MSNKISYFGIKLTKTQMKIYLNNGSTSFPKPPIVTEAIIEHLNALPGNYGRSGIDKGKGSVVSTARTMISDFFNGAESHNLIFTSGSTEALNLAILGSIKEKCHIVTTAIEHNSVYRPLNKLKRDYGIELTIVACDEFGNVSTNDIEKAIKADTKMLVVNHCSNITGATTDIQAISEIAERHDCILVIDGSQSAGVIPIDLQKLNCHYFAFTGHKSLYGLQGCGGLLIRKDQNPEPLKFGGTGFKSDSLSQPQEIPYKYESGTLNIPGIISLIAGIEWILATGIDKIHARKVSIIKKIADSIASYRGIKLYYSSINNSGTLLSFNIGKLPPEEVHYWLETNYNIVARSGLMCSPVIRKYIGTDPLGAVRISPSYFTTDEEVDYTINAIKKIADNEENLI
jgi:cysteine desulfurase / selenocysteine lyase